MHPINFYASDWDDLYTFDAVTGEAFTTEELPILTIEQEQETREIGIYWVPNTQPSSPPPVGFQELTQENKQKSLIIHIPRSVVEAELKENTKELKRPRNIEIETQSPKRRKIEESETKSSKNTQAKKNNEPIFPERLQLEKTSDLYQKIIAVRNKTNAPGLKKKCLIELLGKTFLSTEEIFNILPFTNKTSIKAYIGGCNRKTKIIEGAFSTIKYVDPINRSLCFFYYGLADATYDEETLKTFGLAQDAFK